LAYIDDAGKEKQPIMLHRVLLGSLERFIGALIEQYKGELPLWLSPTQVLIIPLKETVQAYAQEVKSKLESQDIRVEMDLHNETLNKKIRNAEINKIPYCLILGDREAAQGMVSVRKKGSQDQGVVALEEFVGNIINQIREHK
jgi:threonyl-tRNA synthetase